MEIKCRMQKPKTNYEQNITFTVMKDQIIFSDSFSIKIGVYEVQSNNTMNI